MPKNTDIKHFFAFNRGERFGLIVLFIILLGIILANLLLPQFIRQKATHDLHTFKKDIGEFEHTQQILKDSMDAASHHFDPQKAYVDHLNPFPFDPNNLPVDKWKSLGLNDKQIKIIKNYEARGGHFNEADDLAKIYGISKAEFEVLRPFIRIAAIEDNYIPKINKLHPFEFDPNSIDRKALLSMGLSEGLCRSIVNYRNKGGRFYQADDLGRIYQMDDTIFQQLKPYIKIAADTSYLAKETQGKTLLIDLNRADTLDLQQLSGIGPSFARRIVKYRLALGGYSRKVQLMEVFGIDSLRYAQIADHLIISTDSLRKININTAQIKELMKHPYIEYYLAKSIITQRKTIGKYSSLDELLNARLVYDELFKKLKPYLTI